MAFKQTLAQGGENQDIAVLFGRQSVMDQKLLDMESQIVIPSVGMKLNPTPSDDPDDPLNWSMWWKVGILTQTSLLAAIGGLNTAMINPALLQLSEEFHVAKVDASYQTTVCIALNGIAPWLWIPLAYKIGRRPIYLATTMLGLVTILSCAFTQTYTQLLIARIFNGFFPVGFALGATTVTDLFFYHQRGRAMGFFTVTVVNGSHLAPIFGGLIGQYCGWRWIFKFLAIVDAVLFIVAFFFLPETMYNRRKASASSTAARLSATMQTATSTQSSEATLPNMSTESSLSSTSTVLPERPENVLKPRTAFQRYRYYLRFYSCNPDYKLDYVATVMTILRLFRTPTAVFPAIYYATMYGFASILPAVTAAVVFTEFFEWDTLTIGLAYGGALTAGGVLGESLAGWVCDAVVKREQTRLQIKTGSMNDDIKVPSEVRLRPLWPGAILTPLGLIIYGFSLHYRTHPAVPLFGMGLSCFGLQIITTCTYTYAIDCHTNNMDSSAPDPQQPPSCEQAAIEKKTDTASSAVAQVAQLFNFIRQMFGFTYAFYTIRLANKIGYHWTFLLFALCGGVLAFAPMVWLIFRPQKTNKKNIDDEQSTCTQHSQR